jgi:penicillin-binding protein 2
VVRLPVRGRNGKRIDRKNYRKPARKEAEPAMTKARMQVRVVLLAALASALFAVLAFELWHLQVLASDGYQSTARATHTRSVKLPAQRGVVYDRNGEVLANNRPGLNVTVVPDAIGRDKVKELARTLGANEDEVLSRYDAAIATGDRYGPMLVQEDASRDAVTYLSERSEEFPGLVVNDDYVRNYPDGDLLSHVLGYTGAVTEEELQSGDQTFSGLDQDAVVGKGGVELSYEGALRGEPGAREYDVDALGRQVAVRRADGSRYDGQKEDIPELGRPARSTDPTPGKDLRLTVDLSLQKTAEKELDSAIGRAKEAGHGATGGAAVALDPQNGEVLAMASRPDFDPEMFVGGITGEQKTKRYEQLNSEEANAPFLNRATAGTYPGASTFKPFTGLAGLASGAISPSTTVTDTGACWVPTGTSWGCWQSWRENSPKYQYLGPHGTQNYAQALMDSNDKFFYQVADWMWNRTDDQDLLPGYYQKFGFGAKTGVDLPGEAAGRVPTRAWQQKAGATEDDRLWTVGRWVNLSIGQGDLLVNPLQMVRGYAAIANGGELVTPHVGLDLEDQDGSPVKAIAPAPAGSLGVDPSYLQETLRGLRMVTGPGGTAEDAFKGTSLKAAVGKSGTGETSGKDQINWFVGWDESKADPVVVLVMVEGGGAFQEGSEITAAPAVRNILETYYGLSPTTTTTTKESSSSSSGASSSQEDTTTATPTTTPRSGQRGGGQAGGPRRRRRDA